jgi:hypothetical protein
MYSRVRPVLASTGVLASTRVLASTYSLSKTCTILCYPVLSCTREVRPLAALRKISENLPTGAGRSSILPREQARLPIVDTFGGQGNQRHNALNHRHQTHLIRAERLPTGGRAVAPPLPVPRCLHGRPRGTHHKEGSRNSRFASKSSGNDLDHSPYRAQKSIPSVSPIAR